MTDAETVPQQRDRAATDAGSFAIPSLDGVRSVAIAVVVAYHYGHLSGGFLAHVQPARVLGGQHQVPVAQIPPAVLALDAKLRLGLTRSGAAFSPGIVSVIEADQKPAAHLPAPLSGATTTIAAAVTAGRIRIDSATGSGTVLGRVYGYRFHTDTQPAHIAAEVQRFLLARHALDSIGGGAQIFTMSGQTDAATVGIIRVAHYVAILDLTAAVPHPEHAAATYLAALLPQLGGRAPQSSPTTHVTNRFGVSPAAGRSARRR